jgi:hypothetical protein
LDSCTGQKTATLEVSSSGLSSGLAEKRLLLAELLMQSETIGMRSAVETKRINFYL